MEAIGKIEQFRERISEKLLVFGTIVTIPAAIFSGYRILTMGLKPLFIADILISKLLIISYFTRKKINYRKRIFWLVIYVFFLGVLAIYTWGLFGFGFFILFFSCIIITTLFGLRYGIFLLISSVLAIIVFIVCVSLGWLSWGIDFNALSHTTYQWAARLVFYISFSSIAVLSVGLVYKNLINVTKEIAVSELRFRSLYENANDVIFILDGKTIIDCNPKTLELFKCTKEQIIGLMVDEISPKHQMDGSLSNLLAKDLIGRTLQGKAQRFEWRHIRFDGSLFDVEVSLNRIELNEKVFIQAIIRDITERKLLEKRLLNAEIESEEKERLKLAGNLHDEVGPLLSSLNMYISLIERDETESKEDILSTMKDIVKESITTVREISNNLSPHVLNNYGLKSAIVSIVESKRKLIEINFVEELDEERLPRNLEVIIYRIVKELINNTLKYASAETAHISIVKNNNLLLFTYSDNGVGFDSDELLSHNHSGMGLLNIINRMSTLNASYRLYSKPGRGFNFEMSLKLADEL